MSYYGENKSILEIEDYRIGELVTEACLGVDEEVDFRKYDWDGDGEVEQVYILYAGYGENSGAPSYTIWPHKFSLTGCGKRQKGIGPLTLDGVTIDNYACSCELAGKSGNQMECIGCFCHEFSHCLGLPDLYDVNYNGGVGMSYWDVMASGSYSGPISGSCPCGYSAFERWCLGWLEFEELKDARHIESMPDIGSEPTAYIIYNDNRDSEFFVLENRRNERWYKYVDVSTDCHGLLITHVDYDQNAWDKHKINTVTNHQRVSFVPADNDFGRFINASNSLRLSPTSEDLEGDLFPGSKSVDFFTENSHVNVGGYFFNDNAQGNKSYNAPILNIEEKNGYISFDFIGRINLHSPHISKVETISKDMIGINWESLEVVDEYELEIDGAKESPLSHLLLNEEFKEIVNIKDEDGELDISHFLHILFSTKGWEGENLYYSPKGLRIGSNESMGLLKSPYVNFEKDLTVKIRYYNDNSEEVKVLTDFIDENSNIVSSVDKILKKGEGSIVLGIENMDVEKLRISLTSDSVFYLRQLSIYEGFYSEKDLSNFAIISAGLNKDKRIITIDGLLSEYEIKDLKPYLYSIRMRARYHGMSSQWSEKVFVDMSQFGDIYAIKPDGEEVLNIYDLQGRKVKYPYSPGIYIYEYPNYRQKVIIK